MLYDLYEKQKLTEAKMAIYKAFTDNDEMSKSLCMKKYLGWSDEEIKENYMSLILDKQWTATADMMSERISEENPPVEIKSPMKLKKDVDDLEKNFIGGSSSEAGGEEDSGSGEEAAGGDETATDSGEEEAEGEEPAPPTFGLG